MSLAVLVPLSLLLGLIGLGAFFWALRTGQFEDPDGAAWRVIPPQSRNDDQGEFHDRLASDAQDRNPGRGV